MGAISSRAIRCVSHEEYQIDVPKNDIALIITRSPFEKTDEYEPAKIPDGGFTNEDNCVIGK